MQTRNSLTLTICAIALFGCSQIDAPPAPQEDSRGTVLETAADAASSREVVIEGATEQGDEEVVADEKSDQSAGETKPAALQDVVKDISFAPMPDPYRLQIGDMMDIKVRLNPELNEQVIIPPDGLVSTTMAEDVPAFGRTVQELRDDLKKQYSRELKNPKISIILRAFAPNRVYVTGEVNAPGEFVTAGPNLTLMQAIARAGGLKNSANTSNMLILRHSVSAPAMAYSVNYDAATSGASPASDVRLAAYDVVFVPRSGIADVYLYFQQFVQQFLPASFGMAYQLNPQNAVVR